MDSETATRGRSAMEVTPIAANIGAEIIGLDLRSLTDDAFDALHRTWLEHQVVLLRDQVLDDETLQAFAGRFGPLEERPFGNISEAEKQKFDNRYVTVISNIVEDGKPIGGLGNLEASWHSDMTYIETPPTASLLYGVEVPDEGGDTHFASQHAALEILPAALRRQAEAHAIKHDATHNSVGGLRRGFGEIADPREIPGAVHPIVRRHEETGRNCLYLGRRDHAYVDGVTLDESELLLDKIWSYAALPENCMTHRWRVGDLVIWDNRAVLHRRDGFPAEARRMMRRCQVKSAA
jgi:taurine dioxygenase